MLERIKNIKGDSILKFGAFVYILGFLFLFLVGQNYTGLFSVVAPLSIVLGALVISIGLAR
ncbi:MAG: hypothetical protein PHF84_06690 [bacterium]|nr:hypothetical protein [bacterium]